MVRVGEHLKLSGVAARGAGEWLRPIPVTCLGTDATRRYNGSGPASYVYLYHVLKREEAL